MTTNYRTTSGKEKKIRVSIGLDFLTNIREYMDALYLRLHNDRITHKGRFLEERFEGDMDVVNEIRDWLIP